MESSDRSSDVATKRIGIFADGQVGYSILEKLVAYAPESVVALITDKEAIPGEFDVPEGCEAKLWQEQDESERADWLLSRRLDIIILAWWPYLLKERILGAAPVILNTHPSLLPYCRGKDPNFWAIVESAPFGVTLHHVNAAIDAGEIAFQKEIPVSWSDTGGTLYQKALTEMVELFEEALPTIVHGEIPRISQSDVGSLHYRKQLEPASVIDLDAPTTAREVLNRLRARTFPPHPACRFIDGEDVYEARVTIDKVT
ncbi:formyltransferase family protein [Mycobacterium sp. 1245852.3]|uniref:formyltransferase family protein n=1 Tax=Mycobacterium sp. 1245852.3 TaxID=1856860 RepID=UPI000A50B1E4|nr:formyltransferase family protein [Mycobacterium sp. 1245852.3]